MEKNLFSRRGFIRTTGLAAVALGVTSPLTFAGETEKEKNPLPRWKGFNLLDYFSPEAGGGRNKTTEEYLKWMSDWGFNFVRVPMAYPSYLSFDRSRNIKPEEVYQLDNQVTDKIEELVFLANKYKLHVSLNLHRAPGYCINAGFFEPYNLWKDEEAQKAFYYHWEYWAKRFKKLTPEQISFDLVNEPAMREDMNDQHARSSAVPGEVYRKVAKAAAEAIRRQNPGHLVIADGNNVGNTVITEITDLNIAQSCRGYWPGAISHYQAPWANKNPELCPLPVWPGKIGDREYSRKDLEKYYQPWIDLSKSGVGVHCGECGCWKNTPHEVFLAWFGDVIDILNAAGIGYALWNFRGDFGIMDSGRKDVAYEDWHGHQLDRKLLALLQKY
ncbi:MAG TPA: cellulase family glycosylhydrolase [Prolixibacteraceae bacterium]|nr:cellulase family glycosylhydrolase [Prolixibacteraceae bacterium]